MKKRVLVLILTAALMVSAAACGSSKKGTSEGKKSGKTTEQKKTEEKSEAEQQAAKKAQEEKEQEQAKNADPEDPAASSGTMQNHSSEKESKVKARYVGTWVMKGILMRDGSLEGTGGVSGKYVIREDGTYTSSMTNPEGGKTSAGGNWSLNSSKDLSADTVLGISENGKYLLRDSGQRDGKGFRMYYAYVKVN